MKWHNLVFLAYAVTVAYLSLRQGDSAIVEPLDKLGHLFIYTIFALLGLRVSGPGRNYIYLAVGIVLYSALLEAAQSLVPGRVMSGYDVLANIAGVVLGGFLGSWVRRQRDQAETP